MMVVRSNKWGILALAFSSALPIVGVVLAVVSLVKREKHPSFGVCAIALSILWFFAWAGLLME